MIVRCALWMSDSKTTVGELRRYLRDESVDTFEQVPGLRFKAWMRTDFAIRAGRYSTTVSGNRIFPPKRSRR